MSNYFLIIFLNLTIYVFLTIVLFEITSQITMGKEFGRIYKYDQRDWIYTSPKTTFVIPPFFDTYIQTQCNSASYAYVGSNDVASAILYKIPNHHGNMDVKYNGDSQSYETPQKNNYCSSFYGGTIATKSAPG